MCADRIEAKRLVLRPANNREDLRRYLADIDPDECWYQFGCEYDERLLENCDFTSKGVICHLVFLSSAAAMVGYVGIMPCEDDPSVGYLEYYIFREYRGQGYCQEAVDAILGLSFRGELNYVEGKSLIAEVVGGNDVSIHVLEKLGFVKVRDSFRLYDTGECDSGGEEKFGVVCVIVYELAFRPKAFENVGIVRLAA